MNLRITNEDNMHLMARYPDKYFQLAIVDPEYGIGASSMGMGRVQSERRTTKHVKKEWDASTPLYSYFKELQRISRYQIIWGGNYFANLLPPARNWIAWDKVQPEGSTFSMHELAWCNTGFKPMIFRENPSMSKNNISNSDRRQASANARIHPTQKPVTLYKWLLQKYANAGDKILDTHLGSGSIAIACYDLGFDLTACELDADYYRDAMKRIQRHIDTHTYGADLQPKTAQIVTTPQLLFP